MKRADGSQEGSSASGRVNKRTGTWIDGRIGRISVCRYRRAAATAAPGPAHLLYASVNRLDGAKMLALAVLGVAAATMTALPRWLRWAGIALAVTITCSGLVYLLLIASLAAAAGPALVLLLVFMTGGGIVTGMTAGPKDR